MSIYRRSLILLSKLETTYGVDPTPTGAANAVQCINARLSPMEGQDLPRDYDLPAMANQGTIPADLHMKLEFEVDLKASGVAGTVPPWGHLMRGCGCAETISAGVSVSYNPVTSGHESLTHYFQLGGVLFAMLGARGTAKLDLNPQGIPRIKFTFLGLFAKASDGAAPTPDYTAWGLTPLIASQANTPVCTVDGFAAVAKSYSFDLGVKTEPRFLLNSHAILITDRAEKIDMKIEMEPMADFDPYQLALDATPVPITITHGTTAGNRITLAAPLSQIMRPSAIEESQGIVEIPLQAAPQMNAGNDQFTLTCT